MCRSVVSTSLSPEVNKFRDKLAKLLIINYSNGFISENALQEVLVNLIGAQHVGPIVGFRRYSFIASLDSTEVVKKACKMGKLEVPYNYGHCKISFSLWSADVSSKGVVRGAGIWIKI